MKKIMIIEKASELFAKNGFDATSVQEITDACGISKGSFYLSFKSKESLLFSIFEYFSTKLIERISGIDGLDITPKERLEQFFLIQFEEIARYSDFILMQIREQTNPMNDEMMVLMNDMQTKNYEMQERLLTDLYGEEIRLHMPDLSVLLSGIVKGYIEIIVFDKNALDYKGLARFIVERTDSIVKGLTTPFLKKEQLLGHGLNGWNVVITAGELLEDIRVVKLEITDEDILISLDVIGHELAEQNIRKPVIFGMMSNLKNYEGTTNLLKKLKLFLDQFE